MKILVTTIVALLGTLCFTSFKQNENFIKDANGCSERLLQLSVTQSGDAAFLATAAGGGLLEIELGQLAQLNSLDPVLKDLGSKLIRDHSQCHDRIKTLSGQRNISIPASLPEDRLKIKEGLQKKTGADFDREYIDWVIDDHTKTINQFEKEARSGSDKEVKAFADSTLTILHAHLDAAQNYRKTTIKG